MIDIKQVEKTLLIVLISVVLTACSVGPDYHEPQLPVSLTKSDKFVGAAIPDVDSSKKMAIEWWHMYNDPVLNRVVDEALSANTDLRIAIARLEKSRALLRINQSEYFPQTSISAGDNRQKVPEHLAIENSREYSNVNAGIDVSYELDLFGRVRRAVEAARGDWQAAEAERDAVQVAVIADTVTAYADIASTTQQIRVANRTVELLQDSLRITHARVSAGRSDKLDIIRMKTLLKQNNAKLGPLQSLHAEALYRLATLTGRPAGTLPEDVIKVDVLPKLVQPLPVGGGGAELIARRPDVRAAERKLAASTARIGIVTADLYPKVTLGGQLGTSTFGNSGAFNGQAALWSLGGLINWQFPNIAATRARIAGANADASASLAEFDGVVLTALQETETALSNYGNELERNQYLKEARAEATRAATIVTARQKQGQTDFLTVLDAQRTQAEADGAMAESEGQILRKQISVFKALGGGWQTHHGSEVIPESIAKR